MQCRTFTGGEVAVERNVLLKAMYQAFDKEGKNCNYKDNRIGELLPLMLWKNIFF